MPITANKLIRRYTDWLHRQSRDEWSSKLIASQSNATLKQVTARYSDDRKWPKSCSEPTEFGSRYAEAAITGIPVLCSVPGRSQCTTDAKCSQYRRQATRRRHDHTWGNWLTTDVLSCSQCPVWAREHCRISLPRFLAECCKKQLNQGSFVLLYFQVVYFFWFVFSLFICIFLYCFVCQYQSSDWLWRSPPKWPILRRVGR